VAPAALAPGMTLLSPDPQPPAGFQRLGQRIDQAQWRTGLAMDLALSHVQMAVHQGQLYVLGGTKREDTRSPPQAQVWRTTPGADDWEVLNDLPTARTLGGAVVLGEDLYLVAGGDGSGSPLLQNLRYEIASDSWTPVADLPQAYVDAAICGLDGRIYVIGGVRDGLIVGDAVVYDAATDAWSPIAALPQPLTSIEAVGVDGRVFVLGGFGNGGHRNRGLAYDPATDSWTPIAPMPTPVLSAAATATDDGLIWVIGGEENGWARPDTMVYDPAADSWSFGPPLRHKRSGLAAASDGSTIHVAGGQYNHSAFNGAAFNIWFYLNGVEQLTPRPLYLHQRQP
ncbi:MAG: Kelch repeat-containing protein, partial [Planctomycetota bacterium]